MNLEIADRLVELRKKNGYSQEGLAERLGVSRQAVSKWETGMSSPDLDNLITLSKIYCVSLDELVGNDRTDTLCEVVDGCDEVIEKEDDEDEDEESSKFDLVSDSIISFVTLGCIAFYLVFGFLNDIWHPTWIVFFLIAITATLIDSIKRRSFASFGGYPLIVTAIYLLLGFLVDGAFGIHWWLFITIPMYYVLASGLDALINRNKVN